MRTKPKVRYAQSALALLRKSAGLTQKQVATRLGFGSKQLCSIETGYVMASVKVLRALSALYEVEPLSMLRAAVETFETGRLMTRQARRKANLLVLQSKVRETPVDVRGPVSQDVSSAGTAPAEASNKEV